MVNAIDKYVYLGLHLNEFLDFNTTAKFVAQAAGRAFGLLAVKYKAAGGMPFNVFTELFNSTVLADTISRIQAGSARGLNKLRTYRFFKHKHKTET